MLLGSVVLLLGLLLWLMEEASLIAPMLFPKEWLPLGGGGSLQAIFSAVAISGFPLCGLAVRPADASAARTLLLLWIAMSLMLAAVFTATSVIIITGENPGWREPGAEQRPYRSLLHVANALTGYYFALRFSAGLALKPAAALQWAWTTGHSAGALICIVWTFLHASRLPPALVEWNWSRLSFLVPSVAILIYIAMTSSSARSRLLRWVWAQRTAARIFAVSPIASLHAGDGKATARAPTGRRPRASLRPSGAFPLAEAGAHGKATGVADGGTALAGTGVAMWAAAHEGDAREDVAACASSAACAPSKGGEMSEREACDEAAFQQWMHPQLAKAEAAALSVLLVYFCVQLVISHGALAELVVVIIVGVLTSARLLSRFQHRDGETWCVAMITSTFVEAYGVGCGPVGRAHAIAAPRLAHRELAFAACLLIGMIHGTQPLSLRVRLAVAASFELLLLLWLVPLLDGAHPHTNGTPSHAAGLAAAPVTHPALLSSGEVAPGYMALVIGCQGAFSVGFACVHVLLEQACKPLWFSRREAVAAARSRQEQLGAEKERLYFEMRSRQEQLGAEKERLYFEMQFAKQELSKLHKRLSERRHQQAHDEAGVAQHGRASAVGAHTRGRCSPPHHSPPMRPPLGSSNGSCSELDAFDLGAEAHSTTYAVLPEYVNERLQPGGCAVEYCSLARVRERHLLCVCGGRLVNRDGQPLNAAAAAAGEHALYVLTLEEEVLVSFEHARHRHSSLVAGAPVRAAGCLRVRNGELLAFDNASGHYRPDLESLNAFAIWLQERGVPLAAVRIETADGAVASVDVVHDAASAAGACDQEQHDVPLNTVDTPVGMISSHIHQVARPVASKALSSELIYPPQEAE